MKEGNRLPHYRSLLHHGDRGRAANRLERLMKKTTVAAEAFQMGLIRGMGVALLSKDREIRKNGMVSLRYKDHLIVADGQFEEDRKLWRPVATISWNSDSAVAWEILKDSVVLFETTDDAERFGVEMARAWIDEQQQTSAGTRALEKACR